MSIVIPYGGAALSYGLPVGYGTTAAYAGLPVAYAPSYGIGYAGAPVGVVSSVGLAVPRWGYTRHGWWR